MKKIMIFLLPMFLLGCLPDAREIRHQSAPRYEASMEGSGGMDPLLFRVQSECDTLRVRNLRPRMIRPGFSVICN